MAKATYAMGKYRYSCYFSQQAAEKYLKAFLIKNGRLLRKIHDLLKLLEMCKENDTEFKELEMPSLEKLTAFSTMTRYPEFGIKILEKDSREALETAEGEVKHLYKANSDTVHP